MLRPAISLAALAVLTLLVTAVPATAKSCSVGSGRDLGATYVTSVNAKRTTCKKARSLVRAYHRCRRDNGGADGKCPSIRGYSCSERKLADSRNQYDARASCKRGRKRVTQVYTQNT
jgi:hypothetical protein